MELLLYHLINYLSENIPELQTIDEDYGQLEALDNEETDTYPIVFPALLINTPDTEWSGLKGKSQKGKAQVGFRLCLDCYDDTHADSGTLDAVIARQQMVDKLHGLLQGYRPIEDGEMIREKSKFYTWSHGIKVYEIYYTLSVSDIITETVAAPKPKVKISFEKI